MDENKIKYGLKNVYYAKATFDEDGNPEYETPVHILGAVSLSMDAEGDTEPWYADNMVYTVLNGNAGYSGDLEIAIIPEGFATDILHEEMGANGLMQEQTGVEIEHFALMFQFEGDRKAIRHVFYNCTCSRPAIESATTEDTKEPQTDTLQLTAMPLASGYVKGKTCSRTPEGIYNGFFDAVLLPGGEEKTYTVYFYNGNTLLQSVHDVPYGGSATYTGSTPTKEGYTFTGWDPEPSNITKDTYCYAQFEIQTFTVRFYNGSTLLQTVTDVPYGGSAIYTGETPVSPGDPNLRFLGWDPEPTNIKKDTDCYAQFEVQTYTVYFYNGDTLLQTVMGVVYGGSATYTGSTPEKEGYTFIGWDPEPVNITGDTYCYAQFTDALIGFAVYSEDDSSLIFYGDTSVPNAGSTYNKRTVTNVYAGVENTSGTPPWFNDSGHFKTVSFDKSFSTIQPRSTAQWFFYFSNCEKIDLSNLDTCKVTNMSGMFLGCQALSTLDLTPLDTDEVTDMSTMFMSCTGLSSLDLTPLNTSKVTNMENMFADCSGLTTLDPTPLNTSKVTNMSDMFLWNEDLSMLDLTSFDTSGVTDMSEMFRGCSSLITIYSDDSKFVTDKVKNGTDMFLGCGKLVGGAGTKFDSNKVGAEMAHVDTTSNPGYFTAK